MSKETKCVKVLGTGTGYAQPRIRGAKFYPAKVCDTNGNIGVIYVNDDFINTGDEIEIEITYEPTSLDCYRITKNYTQQKMINEFVKQKTK